MRDDQPDSHMTDASGAGMRLAEKRTRRGLYGFSEEVAFRLSPPDEKEPAP